MLPQTRKVVWVAAVLLAMAGGLALLRAASGGPDGWAEVLDLTRLPAELQGVLGVLLLLPAGALVTAVARNVVGIATFGTFVPVLLALSFLYCQAWMAGVVFAVVLAVGLAGRALLGRLRLLMVPRLGVLLTLVVAALALAVSVLYRLGRQADAYTLILPLVVTTMLVERYHVCREEDGRRLAWTLMLGTLLVAGCCLGVLRSQWLGRLLLRFPELLGILASAMLLVGRYSGYRLAELIRFRDVRGGDG